MDEEGKDRKAGRNVSTAARQTINNKISRNP